MAWHSNWGERLGLLALGYHRLLWIHMHCLKHGLSRTAIAEELETYGCPVCAIPLQVRHFGRGIHKAAAPVPLGADHKAAIGEEPGSNFYCQTDQFPSASR